ncbi:MAG: AMP-binding protein [bacterium]
MDEERRYWDMNVEPFLNTPQMREVQFYKLQHALKQLCQGSTYFQKKYREVGITADNVDRKIRSLDDYSRIIPIFTKEDYRDHAAACDGDLIQLLREELPISVDELTLINSTTGTTGDPTPYPFTFKAIFEVWGEHLARGLWRAGARRRDRVLECFGLSMHIGGIATVMGLMRMELGVIPVGAETGTDRIFQMARHYKPTIFIGTPSLASYLVDAAPQKLGKPAREMGIHLLLCGGEPGPGVPEIRKKIEEGFGGVLIDHGGALGVSCTYPEYQGMHHLADDYCLYELVDPGTREPIPLEDGAKGEAVLTPLMAGSLMPLRSSLGDLHEVTTSPCPCGGSGFRYKIVGRTDDMLKVKGVIVYPVAIAAVLESFTPRVTGEFKIVLTEKPPRVEPPLKIKVEVGKDFPQEKLPDLEKELSDAFHHRVKIRPKILWQPPGTFERAMVKSKRFEKLYKED